MVYSVFDLDYTLYSLPKHIPFEYKYLKKEPYLVNLINQLPGKKAIFTNGTRQHAYNSVISMGLENVFHFIEGRDSLNGLKPDPQVFINFMIKNNMDISDKVIFFEDTLSNLKIAKNIGWNTVLITGDDKVQMLPRPSGVDFVFPNIIESLNFFNYHMNS